MIEEEARRIGIGTLGYGFMGKAHSHAYRGLSLFFHPLPFEPELVAICGRTEAKVRESMKGFGYKRFYTDWRDLIEDDEVEVVNNTYPNAFHCEARAPAESFLIELYEFLKSVHEDRGFEPSFYDGAMNCLIMDTILKSVEEERWLTVPEVPR